jgi:hypothetical protein
MVRMDDRLPRQDTYLLYECLSPFTDVAGEGGAADQLAMRVSDACDMRMPTDTESLSSRPGRSPNLFARSRAPASLPL